MQTFRRNLNFSLEQEDSREVIARASNGDGEAFNQLIALHQDNVRRFVSLRVANREDAEDICQEVLIRGFLKLNTFQGRSTLRTWLLSIAKRAVSDFYRENRWSKIINRDQHAATAQIADEPSHGCDSVREICHARHHIEDCLRCVMTSLALEGQVAVLLADVMGCSDKETGRVMGKSLGALKHLLHDARASMDIVSKATCALVRKTGDGPECGACRAILWRQPVVLNEPDGRRAAKRRREPGNRALLSLRAYLLSSMEAIIHPRSSPAPLALKNTMSPAP